MISRNIGSEIASSKKSVLLLGPRQVGKSTLVNSLSPDLEINLADELEYLRYSSRPEAFREEIEASRYRSVFVDEIQRLPKLLNTIQALVDKKKDLRFFLTGSSARKLKRGEANLNPGRLVHFFLGPLVSNELDYRMDTNQALSFGTLPEMYLGKDEKENKRILRSYAGSYLKEEIQAEALVRNLDSFSRFLLEVTNTVAEFVDFTKLAKRAMVSRHAIPRYFEILEDTLVGYRVNAFRLPERLIEIDLIKHPKFFFFDNGVYNGLLSNFVASADRIGKLSEQLVYSQLLHSSWSKDLSLTISTFRTRAGLEVDFVCEMEQNLFAIEVKNSDHLTSSDLEGLSYFSKLFPAAKGLFVFHLGKKEKKYHNIWSLPWQKGLRAIGL